MRKGVFAIALLCLAAALLPACQPTPEEEIVVQQGEAADVPAGPVLAELLPLPERVDRPEQTLGGAAVTIAAQVIQPNAQACPVVEVRQTTFSRERLRELTERFCPGAELYHYWQPTQRELLEQRAVLLEYGDDSEDSRIKLDWLDETIPTAPLTEERVPFDWSEELPATYAMVCAVRGPEEAVSAFHLGPQTFVYFRTRNHSVNPESIYTAQEFERFPAPSVGQDEAQAAAEEVLAQLGLTDAMLLSKTERMVVMYANVPLRAGYMFTFTPGYGGLASVPPEGYTASETVPPSVVAPWDISWLYVFVDEEGIAQIGWSEPVAFGEVLEGDAALLPFEQMLERAEQQLLYLYAADGLPGGGQTDAGEIRTRIEVTRISLVRGCIQLRDERDVGQSVPLWRFDYLEHYGEDADPLEHVLYLDARTGAYAEPRMDMETLMQLTS